VKEGAVKILQFWSWKLTVLIGKVLRQNEWEATVNCNLQCSRRDGI